LKRFPSRERGVYNSDTVSLQQAGLATILIVEDDAAVARAIIDALDLGGYCVWRAIDGADARSQLERSSPDLVLLDLILPDIDGLVLCCTLKALANVPIVICSGSVRRSDPILALKLGADDYIHKPFDLDDLLARIEAVLRRTPPSNMPRPQSPKLRVGELVVEPARHRVLVGNQYLALTPTEFRLVSALAARPEEVISRDELAHGLWGTSDINHGRTIDVHVRRLRIKLSSASAPAPAIISVRSSGYKLTTQEASSATTSAARHAWHPEASPSLSPSEATEAEASVRVSSRGGTTRDPVVASS
jgi:DNA-binding response OmpR family regulator